MNSDLYLVIFQYGFSQLGQLRRIPRSEMQVASFFGQAHRNGLPYSLGCTGHECTFSLEFEIHRIPLYWYDVVWIFTITNQFREDKMKAQRCSW